MLIFPGEAAGVQAASSFEPFTTTWALAPRLRHPLDHELDRGRSSARQSRLSKSDTDQTRQPCRVRCPARMLERRENIGGKTREIQIQSGVKLTMDRCQLVGNGIVLQQHTVLATGKLAGGCTGTPYRLCNFSINLKLFYDGQFIRKNQDRGATDCISGRADHYCSVFPIFRSLSWAPPHPQLQAGTAMLRHAWGLGKGERPSMELRLMSDAPDAPVTRPS